MLESVFAWVTKNPVYATLIATIVMAVCAAYPVLKEVVPWLMRTAWSIIRGILIFAWWIITPIRRPVGLMLQYFINKVFEWIERHFSEKADKPGNEG